VNVDICGTIVKSIILRIMHDVHDNCELTNEELIINAFDQIPPSELVSVIETVYIYLNSTLNEITSFNIKRDKLGTITNPENRALYNKVLLGVVHLFTLFVDYTKEKIPGGNEDKHANEFGKLQNQGITLISHEMAKSNVVTSETISILRRLLALSTDYSTYLSMNELKDNSFCKQIAKQASAKRANELLQSWQEIRQQNTPLSLLTTSIRKFCTALHVSPVYFSNCVIEYVLEKGSMVSY
jgi:hypothetical protein